jgi:protein-histidine N-methyltransferase
MPSTSLLQYLLTQPPPSPSAPNNRKVHFTLCDYNLPVLALASFPNLLLSHAATSHVQLSDCAESENDLDITKGLLSDFRATLSARNITINFISGAWGPQFVELVRQSSAHLSDSHECLVLASETIYSPSSLPAFTSTLSALLQTTDPDHCESVALIAAKRIYFGVGGGVADFISQAREEGLVVKDKWATDEDRDNSDDEEDAGVARVVMEVRRAETTVRDSGPRCHRNVEEWS